MESDVPIEFFAVDGDTSLLEQLLTRLPLGITTIGVDDSSRILAVFNEKTVFLRPFNCKIAKYEFKGPLRISATEGYTTIVFEDQRYEIYNVAAVEN